MHEFSYIQSLIDVVEKEREEKKFRQVVRLKLAISSHLFHQSEEFIASFEKMAAGSCLEGANLELETISPKANCFSCVQEFEVTHYPPICPSCGECGQLLPGECYLKELEVTNKR